MLILGTNSIKDTGYSVANSCRFDGSSAYMSKTMGTATNRLKLTMSVWLKRSTLGASVFFSSYYSASYRYIITSLKSVDRYRELSINQVDQLITFLPQELHPDNRVDFYYGDYLLKKEYQV